MYLSFALQLIHNSSENTAKEDCYSYGIWGVFKWEKMPSVIKAQTTKLISLMAYREQELGPALQRKQVSALWAAHASSFPATGKWRQAKSSGINLEYAVIPPAGQASSCTQQEALRLKLWYYCQNSIFYIHLFFMKGINTNIPWEYKTPTKVISVNRGKKMRPRTTVIS